MKTKFITMGAIALSMLSLASCFNTGSKADYSTTRQVTTIDTDMQTAFNLFYDSSVDDKNAQLLDTDTKSGSYYDLYVAKDATASLFTYSWNMNDYLSTDNGSRNKTVTISTLSFAIKDSNGLDSEALYDEEKTAILSAAYDADKGVAKKLTVDFTVTTSTDYARSFDTDIAYTAKEAGENVSLAIVYMPVYVIHYVSNQPVLRNYVFLPIYATFTTATGKEVSSDGSLVDSKIAFITDTVVLENYFGDATGTLKASLGTTTPEDDDKDDDTTTTTSNGLSAGAIVGIVLGSVFGFLIILYFVLGFTLYKNGTLNGGFWRAIYKWIKRSKK